MSADEIAASVAGIDIHPLSVQITKNTVLLALGEKIKFARRPINLRIFLANTLFTPKGSVELFGNTYKLTIDREIYHVDMQIFENTFLFDEAIDTCDTLADMSEGKKTETLSTFTSAFKNRLNHHHLSDKKVIESFYKIYHGLKQAKDQGRDSIWKFILQNLYKPYFFKQSFDLVIGNPPWLTYKDVTNKDYQKQLSDLAQKYRLLPKTANMPHLELAAIFLSHSASYFLKPGGKIAFVLPRSFLTADHHDNTRAGKAEGFRIKTLWDLKDVSPLFRVPSCVFFSEKAKSRQSAKDIESIPGLKITGRIGDPNASFETVKKILTSEKVEWHYVKLGKHSAYSNVQLNLSAKPNYYKPYFKQGATIVPRNFYFVEVSQDTPPDWDDRILSVKTAQDTIAEAKKPWKDFRLRGRIHSQFLFRTALAKNIVPFGLIHPRLVILPIRITQQQNIQMLNWKILKKEGYLDTALWFKEADELWDKNKTQRSEKMNFVDRLDFQKGISIQSMTERYLILYTASAKNANATIIDRTKLDLHFIAESKTYWFGTNDEDIAYYLACFLNSDYANEIIKDFQTTGLFGPRDIHKRILEVPLPFYNARENDHKLLAEMGKKCEKKVTGFLSSLGDYNVGTLRMQVRSLLSHEWKEIDGILKKLI